MSVKREFPFTIGADPEFNFVIGQHRIDASRLLPTLLAGKFPSAANRTEFQIGKHGNMGVDGNAATAELRPAPSASVDKLTENIGAIIGAVATQCRLFDASTKNRFAPVGGHIHIGLPNTLPMSLDNVHKRLSSFGLLLLLGESVVNSKTRFSSGYGEISDYRTGTHGMATTYEIRWPSAEWLITPKITRSTLAFIATVFNEIVNKKENFDRYKSICYGNKATGTALQDLALNHYSGIVEHIGGKIRKAIKTFEFYEAFKEEIDYICRPDMVLRDKERADFNILTGWGHTKSSIPTKRILFSEKQVAVAAKKSKADLDVLEKLVPIYHNSDTKVDEFAAIVRRRSLMLNWKFRNTYFFYGLKRGIPDFVVSTLSDEYLHGWQQCATRGDADSLVRTLNNMRARFKGAVPTLGLSMEELRKFVLIGIPYDLRVENKPKKLLNVVHDIEKGKMKMRESMMSNDLFDDIPLINNYLEDKTLDEKIGSIWRANNIGYSATNLATPANPNTMRAHARAVTETTTY